MHPLHKIISAVEERDVDRLEAFAEPLLRDFVVEVLGFGCEDDVRDFGFIEMVEPALVLGVEPGRVEGGLLLRHGVLV